MPGACPYHVHHTSHISLTLGIYFHRYRGHRLSIYPRYRGCSFSVYTQKESLPPPVTPAAPGMLAAEQLPCCRSRWRQHCRLSICNAAAAACAGLLLPLLPALLLLLRLLLLPAASPVATACRSCLLQPPPLLAAASCCCCYGTPPFIRHHCYETLPHSTSKGATNRHANQANEPASPSRPENRKAAAMQATLSSRSRPSCSSDCCSGRIRWRARQLIASASHKNTPRCCGSWGSWLRDKKIDTRKHLGAELGEGW